MSASSKKGKDSGNKQKSKSRLGRPPLASRGDRSPEMRQRLINAAMESIVDVGYARTSVGEVVKRAGVTKGAFVYVFKNKLELIRATIDYLFEAGRIKTDNLVIRSPETVEEIEGFLQLTADVLLDKIGMAIFEVWMAARTDPELHETFRLIEARNTSLREQVLARAFGQKVVESTDLQVLSFGAILILRGLSLQEVLQGGMARSEPWLWWRRRLAEEIIACKSQSEG